MSIETKNILAHPMQIFDNVLGEQMRENAIEAISGYEIFEIGKGMTIVKLPKNLFNYIYVGMSTDYPVQLAGGTWDMKFDGDTILRSGTYVGTGLEHIGTSRIYKIPYSDDKIDFNNYHTIEILTGNPSTYVDVLSFVAGRIYI